MIGPVFGNELYKGLVAYVAVAVSIAFILGGFCVYALPKLWSLLKPWLHMLTT